jgi:EF-P beta-lysylation protein EpmB
MLGLPQQYWAAAERAGSKFPVFAPLGFVARMRPRDPHDPLLRQVLPLPEELSDDEGFSQDPVGDREATIVPGLLQKYSSRVLLIVSGACAIHCRYCFRREFPYSEGPKSVRDWAPAIERIRADESVEEVLLSGGDPLTLVDAVLAELVEQLESVQHLRRLRIHTRLPIVIPERVNEDLLKWLVDTRLTPIVVVHANHPAEIDCQVGAALTRLVERGILVFNQSVLLRGVNDDPKVLRELCSRLIDLRVVPYYLHQLDRVQGASHFEVPVSLGRELIQQLRESLPGYAVPRYVQEVPGAGSKQVLA